MAETRERRVFVRRGWWVPLLLALVSSAVVLDASVDALLDPDVVLSLIASGYGLVLAAWLAPRRLRAFVVLPGGLGEVGLFRPWTELPWDQIRSFGVEAGGAWLLTPHDRVCIGADVAHWQTLLAEVAARTGLDRAGSAPETEPLSLDELAAWLGGRPFTVWAVRPLTQTLLPLVLPAMVAGAAIGVRMLLGEDFTRPSWLDHGDLEAAAGVGALLGFVFALLPALVSAAPLRVAVRPSGLTLHGLTRWGARRSWDQLRVVRRGHVLGRLVTEHESLVLSRFSPRVERLLHAATQVLEGSRQGRLPDLRLDVPDTALSLAEPAETDAIRGISPAAESGA